VPGLGNEQAFNEALHPITVHLICGQSSVIRLIHRTQELVSRSNEQAARECRMIKIQTNH
jgi:hypothetical protein